MGSRFLILDFQQSTIPNAERGVNWMSNDGTSHSTFYLSIPLAVSSNLLLDIHQVFIHLCLINFQLGRFNYRFQKAANAHFQSNLRVSL